MSLCSSTLNTWLAERLAAKKLEVVALDAAISALQSGAQMYSLDTGQTRQSVTKANLSALIASRTALENEIVNLSNRLSGEAVLVARPGF
jgi:hypothetical protein